MKKELPNHYSLIKEHPDHFMVHDKRDNKAFPISKKGLHPATQMKVLRMPKYSEGGEIPKMDSGGVSGPEDTEEDGVDEGVSVGTPPSLAAPEESDTESPQPSEQSPQDMSFVPQFSSQPAGPQETPGSPPSAAPQPGGSLPPGYPTSQEIKGYTDQALAGNKNEVTAEQKQNNLMAQQYQKNMDEQQKYLEAQNQKLTQYQNQYDELSKSVASGKIDPNKYWHDKSTGQKIGAAVAIMLGGIGSGLTGGPNQALNVIQKGIENDIAAQKENLGNKRSLLSDNIRAQGSLMAGTNATRIQMNAIAQGRLMKVASETNNPILAARAQQNALKIAESTIPLRLNVANNEIQMGYRKDIMQKLQTQGQPGSQPIDMQDLARAGLVDKGTAEKEGAGIQKRQQSEAYIYDQVKKLDGEQRVWGDGIVPNIANPGSYARRDQYRAGIIQAIQNASPSKKLNPEMLAIEAEPFLTKTLDSDKTREEGLNGLIGLVRSHADPTPMATHFKVPGAVQRGNINRKTFDMGPAK